MQNGVELAHVFPPGTLQAKIEEWLAEDIPSFDYGGAVVGDKAEEVNINKVEKKILFWGEGGEEGGGEGGRKLFLKKYGVRW